MNNQEKLTIVIVGGGTAGWMTASALSKFLPATQYQIKLIESEQIGSVGVGEATIPHIRLFNQILGINEAEFMKETHATFKLGIELSHWNKIGDSYIHPFGDFGEKINDISFHNYWLKLKQQGFNIPLSHFSVPVVAANNQKFDFPHSNKESLLSMYGYAYHLDATSYSKFLRKYSENNSVERIEGIVEKTNLSPSSGNITSLKLNNKSLIEGDFFIDCSGFRALLIENALNTGFDDWSHWFICDSAIAVQSELNEPPSPYTKAIASDFGWKWQIPLQHRMGNGYVYSQQYCDDNTAIDDLLSQISGKLTSDPKIIKFTPGRRKKTWNKNCVAIGLSSGFLEPLESTSLYLIQVGIMKLLEFMPSKNALDAVSDEYNTIMKNEYDRIKYFLILHYVATQRDDTAFWRHVSHMEIPQSLQNKIELFKASGHVAQYKEGLFLEPSWLAVYFGQGIIPDDYHPFIKNFDSNKLNRFFNERASMIKQAVNAMPTHQKTIDSVSAQLFTQTSKPSMSLYGEHHE